ncbi:hypothetical protein DPMN_020038 [Dreissena polymorpha]|uniref:Uncharacterized protein n=1 Tax=Dreissena polymorpha TaxID=45954 RepID=A0A9D4NKD5_DREPO|nr:hypothetical protein DPMN_020038 [Dreissena polymorpha]
MFAIVFWEDSTFSVIALRGIVSPRKEEHEYYVGDLVQAKFQGKLYSATIYEIGDNRGNLNKTLNAGFKIDMSRVQPDAQRKRHTSAPEEENKQGADEPHKKKRRHVLWRLIWIQTVCKGFQNWVPAL